MFFNKVGRDLGRSLTPSNLKLLPFTYPQPHEMALDLHVYTAVYNKIIDLSPKRKPRTSTMIKYIIPWCVMLNAQCSRPSGCGWHDSITEAMCNIC